MSAMMMLMLACAATEGGSKEDKAPLGPGGSVFRSQCAMCHGKDGKLSMSGAKDLTKSTLTKEEMNAIVTYGKGGMIGFGRTLSKKQIEEVVDHVRTLRVEDRKAN